MCVFKCFVYVYMFVEYLWKAEMANTAVQQALKFFVDRLGYESLKPKQETVVWEFLSGKIVFVALPMGYGKSLCYACLPYAFDNMRGKEGSIVITCITPGRSESQVCPKMNVSTVCRWSAVWFPGRGRHSWRQGAVTIHKPRVTLLNPSWRDMLRTAVYWDNLSGFLVDEAHCVKKWLVNTDNASFPSQSTTRAVN